MTSLDMPGFAIAVGGDSSMKPEYPSVFIRTYDELDLPEGDFFFLAIGHVKRKEEVEEDDGTKCFHYSIEMHAIQPVSSIEDEKKLLKPDGSFEDDFEDAAKKMQDLKEEEPDDEYMGDEEDDDEEND